MEITYNTLKLAGETAANATAVAAHAKLDVLHRERALYESAVQHTCAGPKPSSAKVDETYRLYLAQDERLSELQRTAIESERRRDLAEAHQRALYGALRLRQTERLEAALAVRDQP